MNVAERLKQVRELNGYTQREVAQAIGVPPVTYQAYERKRAETPLRVLIALSEFYGYFSIDTLLGRVAQVEYCEDLLNRYLKASPEKRQIINYILSLK